ncbi:POTRA domain-containing protein [Pseudomonas sp. JS3066]|jgi:hemolysin activation/secretion protein|uniref:ShlB/FhaC/HecB family hemolysin secretion/activation protein n=1 Tax=unclassified Pseudomonas TaxID=196821 RepID=UPI000EA89269|nr:MULTISPECIES: POTRA domain-containing protein [unclassified Pseudomonas]AYF89880.1 ShlB/FhaC/HecB family hemolysin secretion/activation protein [Pseudomonas sp. DY-1]WVK92533.1 POTRA domain-containing protein [Pseudomonas sp. JS3066]
MRASAVLLALGCVVLNHAQAQQSPVYLNSNEIERQLPAPNLPTDAYRPKAPSLKLPEATKPQPLMMSTRVRVREVRIEGGSIYPSAQLNAIYQPFVGREVSLGELIEATRGLTRRYQGDGYLLSYAFLPVQGFEQGRVRVVLVEGYVKDYQVEGDIGAVRAHVDKLVARLQAERPLTRKTFERYTSLMARVPGVTLIARVPPPATTDGASRLQIQASRKPWTSSLNFSEDNRGSAQAVLGLSSNAQTAMAEQVSFSVLAPPGKDDERYYRLDYSQYLGSDGTRLNLYGSHYRSQPEDNLRLANGLELERHLNNDRLSIGVSHPVIAAQKEWLSLGARLYGVNDRVRYEVVGFPLGIDADTDLRAIAFEGDWSRSDDRRLRILSAGLYRGMDALGARTDSDLFDLEFTRLRLSGVQSERFGKNWQGVLSAALYWSEDSLPDAEQAVFGGQNFGRGYPSDQASGDKGWGAAVELNYSHRREGRWVRLLQPYVVVDTAQAWFNEQPLPRSHLSSLATGVRMGDAHYYNVALEVARPMSDEALDSRNRSPRVTLSFSYQL